MDAAPRRQVGTIQVSRPVQWLLRLLALGILALIVWLSPPVANWPRWLSALGWIALSAYWAKTAKNAAPAKSSEPAKSRRVHEVLFNIAVLLLFFPLPGLRQRFLPLSSAWIAVGLIAEAGSLALAIWARRHLGRNWSARIEIKTGHELVRTGPYRLLRHPIYTAVVGMTIGTALVNAQMHALVGVAIIVVAYWRKVRMEEANMRTAFGAHYDDYRRATWGAIPGLF